MSTIILASSNTYSPALIFAGIIFFGIILVAKGGDVRKF
jgi:hypothetical protein